MSGSSPRAMSGAGNFPRPFGKYTLLASLGRGGMGEVFAAKTAGIAGIEKRCVIKTLPGNLGDDREYVVRFLDEARLVVQLNQRNICSVFDVGTVDGAHYLAMDLIRGRDLRAIWKRAGEAGKRVDPGLAIYIVTEVLEGLDYAHRLTDNDGVPIRIVHRDVSPQNVMVSFEGDVKLIDFGLAASTLKVEKTEPNVVMGKVAYMPPEQVRGEPIDARADVFAAAVILYELVSGERFYEGTPPLMLPGLVASGGHVPRNFGALDPELAAAISTALRPEREQRVPSAAALADSLRALAAQRLWRGDAGALRKLMRELYGEDQRADWERSSTSGPGPTHSGSTSFAGKVPKTQPGDTLPAPPSPREADAFAAAATTVNAESGPATLVLPGLPAGVISEPTSSLTARSGSTSSSSGAWRELPLKENTAATEVVPAVPRRRARRKPLLLAGVAVAGIVIAALVVALASPPAPTSALADAGAPESVAALVVDPVPSVADAGAAVALAEVKASASDAGPAPPEAVDDGEPKEPRPKPREPKRPPVPPKKPLPPPFEQVEHVLKSCQHLPCGKQVKAAKERGENTASFQDWLKQVERCYRKCTSR